jgi:hypothetical protein
MHTKLLAHIPNKKELHLTAHAPTPVGANELPVYPSKSSMCHIPALRYFKKKTLKNRNSRVSYIMLNSFKYAKIFIKNYMTE